MRSVLCLVDETCTGLGDHLAVNFWKEHPQVPVIGSVIRLHRIKAATQHEGVWPRH